MSGATLAAASATAPARSLPTTLNLTAIRRLPCSRYIVDAPGRTNCPRGSAAPFASRGVTRSPSRRRGELLILFKLALAVLPVNAGIVLLLPLVDSPLLGPESGVCEMLGA